MGKSVTSEKPLVRRPPRRRTNWVQEHITRPLSRFSPTSLFVKKHKPSPARSVYVNEPLPSDYLDKKGKVKKEYVYDTNQVITSKYTVITFLPRNLLEQFRRVANVFFAAIAILQFFPKFSTISPGLVILPLLAVLAITALKDGYEDWKRHQADRKVNHGIVHVLGGGEYKNNNAMAVKDKTFVPGIPIPRIKSKKAKKKAKEDAEIAAGARGDSAPGPEPRSQDVEALRRMQSQVSTWHDDPEAGDSPAELGWHRTRWEDIAVGDFVKIYDNEQFPADIMICATSEEEDVAYIETKNLDGETNLKSRNAVSGLNDLRTADVCAGCPLRIDLEAPEVNMFKLNGAAVKLAELGHSETNIHPITLETTLLRGCVLRNTAWVIGVVIFTGHDSKIVANSGGTPSKRSKVERQMNPQVLFNLSILAVIAVVCALVDHFNEVRWYRQQAYWELYADRPGDNPNINGLVTFANAFITFQNIVPISLYISIEFIRTAQALFIYWDHAIKYVKNGVTTRTKARSWTLSDDLGQIQYIFSDKTGTLTQNAMIFRQCSVGGKIYIGDDKAPEGTITAASGSDKMDKGQSSSSDSSSDRAKAEQSSHGNGSNDVKVALPKEVLAPFHDDTLNRDLEDHDSEQSRILHGFFSVLGLCHTVLAAEPEPGVIEYKAQSPDEAALVQSAADVGFVFRGRDKNILRMSTPFADEPDEYELLHVLEFNSSRKRMSVILRKMDDDGRLFLLCKGADNVIFERLAKDGGQDQLKAKTDKDLQHFASEGLRTLCLAYKVLDGEYYQDWARRYHDATVALEGREQKVEDISAEIENDLVLLGATAIEDKLQDGVPEAIADLKQAGLKIWVATGDKLETAVAIGYTTNLLTQDSNLIIIREGQYSVADQIREALESFFDEPMSRQVSRSSARGNRPGARRFNTGVSELVGQDNGQRPGGFSLVIEGHALRHAFEDEETEDLLLDLSTRCNTVICCRVSPLQKAQIVRLIKDNLGVMCLAIGDGANDVSMIQAADVGVGISGEEGLQAVNSSDYAIAQFRYLKRLLFVHGHWSYYRNSSMILNFFYKNIIGIGVLFWYMIYCGWSTTYVLSYTYLLFWNVFWTLTPVLAIGLFDRNVDADILMAFPELYKLSKKGSYFGLGIFWYYMLEGVFESAIIYFFIHYTYDTTTLRPDGYDTYIYEMSTTMAVAAVMVANAFHAINIRTWVGWTYFAILLGPFLVWVYTAIFSLIPPSSFATGVYGNHVFLFRSAAYWFGWIFVFILALLPRYLFLAIKLNYFPSPIDELRLVRKYHPDVDFTTHPMFSKDDPADAPNGNPNDSAAIAMSDLQRQKTNRSARSHRSDISERSERSSSERPAMAAGRPSMSSARFGANSSARGSQVDMSMGGLHREPSRGFDFNMEEGGVAVSRMQSRLSERSAQGHRSKRFLPTLAPMNKERKQSTSTPFGISRIRERAGSVFTRRGRSGTDGSHAVDSPSKSRKEAREAERERERRGTHETISSDGAETGNGRQRRKGSGNDDPRRPGEEGGTEDTDSRAGVGEDVELRGAVISPPEPPRV